MPFTGHRPYKCPFGCTATFKTEKKALDHAHTKCKRRGKKVNYVKRPKDDE